jgi:hypothetical protein
MSKESTNRFAAERRQNHSGRAQAAGIKFEDLADLEEVPVDDAPTLMELERTLGTQKGVFIACKEGIVVECDGRHALPEMGAETNLV